MKVEEADEAGIPLAFRRPILPGPRFIHNDVIERDEQGYPVITPKLILIDCSLPEEEIEGNFPAFWKYLKHGKHLGISATYLASKRKPWYSQEKRPAAPFISTYMGRSRNGSRPFRVIWNKSDATAHNVFLLLYPKPEFADALRRESWLYSVVFEHLQNIQGDAFTGEGRVYGGGLHRMEPKEMKRVPISNLVEFLHPSNLFKGQLSMQPNSEG